MDSPSGLGPGKLWFVADISLYMSILTAYICLQYWLYVTLKYGDIDGPRKDLLETQVSGKTSPNCPGFVFPACFPRLICVPWSQHDGCGMVMCPRRGILAMDM